MEIIYNPDKLALLQLAAKAIEKELRQAKDDPVLVLLSGGSSLQILDYLLTKYFKPNVTIGLIDERWSDNPKDLNSTIILQSDFFKKIVDNGVEFIPIKNVDDHDQEKAAKRYQNELENWFINNRGGKAIAVFGIASDGHTGGIMPYPEKEKWFNKVFLGKSWVVAYDASGKNPFARRITVSLSFIKKKIKMTIVYMTGNEKTDTFRRLMSESGSFAETPARIHRETQASQIFTDIFLKSE